VAQNKNKKESRAKRKIRKNIKAILHHASYHGNAFNPDPKQIVQYKDLSTCSEGHFWRGACKDEFNRLMDGHITACQKEQKQ